MLNEKEIGEYLQKLENEERLVRKIVNIKIMNA
jgi:hypothetical protein